MAFFEFPRYSNYFALETPDDIEKVKSTIEDSLGGEYQFKAIYMRDLLEEILYIVSDVTEEFNQIFGENIFHTIGK